MKTAIGIFFSLLLFSILIMIPKPANAQTVSIDPPVDQIDDTVGSITYNISDLDPSQTYKLCMFIDSGIGNVPSCATFSGQTSLDPTIVCGAGEQALKTDCGSNDFFHGGNNYSIFLVEGDQSLNDIIDAWNRRDFSTMKDIGFFVYHYIPDIAVAKNGDTVSVAITGTTRPGGNSNNNYVINIKKPGTSMQTDCMVINSSPKEFNLDPGTYSVEIREQTDDTGLLASNCNSAGGFFYQTMTLTVNPDGTITITNRIDDPDRKDNAPGIGAGHNPCTKLSCPTAFGNLATNLSDFTQNALKIATGIAGGLALILMVFGSIRVLTSSGDQQRLTGGREMITAAVVGLLFIIFSVVILKFIGINIIGLP